MAQMASYFHCSLLEVLLSLKPSVFASGISIDLWGFSWLDWCITDWTQKNVFLLSLMTFFKFQVFYRLVNPMNKSFYWLLEHVWLLKGMKNVLLHLQQRQLAVWHKYFPKAGEGLREKWSRKASDTVNPCCQVNGPWRSPSHWSALCLEITGCYLFMFLVVSGWSRGAKKLSVRVSCDTKQAQVIPVVQLQGSFSG